MSATTRSIRPPVRPETRNLTARRSRNRRDINSRSKHMIPSKEVSRVIPQKEDAEQGKCRGLCEKDFGATVALLFFVGLLSSQRVLAHTCPTASVFDSECKSFTSPSGRRVGRWLFS